MNAETAGGPSQLEYWYEYARIGFDGARSLFLQHTLCKAPYSRIRAFRALVVTPGPESTVHEGGLVAMAPHVAQPHLESLPLVVLVVVAMVDCADVAQLLAGHVLCRPVPVLIADGSPLAVVEYFQSPAHAARSAVMVTPGH